MTKLIKRQAERFYFFIERRANGGGPLSIVDGFKMLALGRLRRRREDRPGKLIGLA